MLMSSAVIYVVYKLICSSKTETGLCPVLQSHTSTIPEIGKANAASKQKSDVLQAQTPDQGNTCYRSHRNSNKQEQNLPSSTVSWQDRYKEAGAANVFR